VIYLELRFPAFTVLTAPSCRFRPDDTGVGYFNQQISSKNPLGEVRRVQQKRYQVFDLDYVSVFHRHLSISVREERYVDPALQPSVVEERYWKREANVEMKEG
jgi:hypothetical protein